MKKIPITKYITVNATYEAVKLCNEYGHNPVTIQQVYSCLNHLLKEGGEEALKEFALIHPDRDLILQHSQKEESNFSNANGMNFSCEKTSNAAGEVTDSFKFNLKENLPFILVIAGLIVLVKIV